MKVFYIIILLLTYSCSNTEDNKKISITITKYIEKYPISLKNYNYIIRFYSKNTDTILEISRDRIDITYSLGFIFNEIDTTDINNPKDRFIKIGNTKINNKLVFIFDTHDTIGKKLYSNFKIKKEEHEIEELKYSTYPFLPETRIYKFSNNNLIFIEETDTIKFHYLNYQ